MIEVTPTAELVRYYADDEPLPSLAQILTGYRVLSVTDTEEQTEIEFEHGFRLIITGGTVTVHPDPAAVA